MGEGAASNWGGLWFKYILMVKINCELLQKWNWCFWKVFTLILFIISCAPQEEINDKLSAGYMAIYFTDTIHDP
jgi:hypothetical protein